MPLPKATEVNAGELCGEKSVGVGDAPERKVCAATAWRPSDTVRRRQNDGVEIRISVADHDEKAVAKGGGIQVIGGARILQRPCCAIGRCFDQSQAAYQDKEAVAVGYAAGKGTRPRPFQCPVHSVLGTDHVGG